jgi:hypothetical protein
MVRPDIITLVSRETQSSNTGVYKKDLPKQGGISAIDLGFRLTNGATSAVNLDLLDVIKKIELIFNGTDRRYSLTGQELFRLNWLKFGAPMMYNWDQSGSAVQEVRMRLQPGRYIGDPQYGIDLSKFNNVQLNVDYDCTVWGAAAATTFATGTFTPSVLLHMFQPGQVPGFKGMIGAREIWNYTTVGGSLRKDIDLPSQNPISGIAVVAMEDNVAEGTDITDVIIGKDQYRTRWIDGKWYDLQPWVNERLTVREETFKLYPTAADSLDGHLANIKHQMFHSVQLTPTATASDAVNIIGADDPVGNRSTIAGTCINVDTDATPTVVGKAMVAGTETWLTNIGDVHGMLYFPFGDQMELNDVLTRNDLQSAQVQLLDAAAGAYTAVIVEEIYS